LLPFSKHKPKLFVTGFFGAFFNMNYFRSALLIIIVFCVCAVSRPAVAQSIPQNLSNINVNDLSDSQINQLLQQAQARGYSDSQIISQAEAMGLPTDQALILQKRIAAIRAKNGGSNSSSGTNNSQDTSSNQNRARRLNFPADTSVKYDTTNNKQKNGLFDVLKPKIFGADLFRNANSSFQPNLRLATPANYVVGPDDQLNIDVFGNSVASWQVTVTPEGNINIPGAGVLNISGKTIEQATAAIKERLAANKYAIGRGTSVQVALGNIRSISVILAGQVERPGTYTLPSLATVFNALYEAGGPSDNGSFRQIEVIRNNRLYKTLDVYDFLTKGEQRGNIILQDQDIVRVPTYRVRVEMRGEVKIPALFEVLPGESLQNVLDFAGGFTSQAYTGLIKVSQIADQQRRLSDIPEADFKNYIPLQGDVYTVDTVLDRYENRVTINGAVFRPGEYELQKGETLTQLITKAAGLKEDAFMGTGSIIRLNPDNTTSAINFNLKDLESKTAPDIALQREDIINIASIFDLRDKYTITINGAVRRPGTFPYADSISVVGLIVEAGGFSQGGSPLRVEVARRITNGDKMSKDSKIADVFTTDVDPDLRQQNLGFTLKPFDIVSVYSLPGYEKQRTITVEGEVQFPGPYTIQTKNEKISDIIKRAGGLSAFADPDGATLKRNYLAILGVDKNTADSAEIENERVDRITRLQKTYRDTTDTSKTRNQNQQMHQRNNDIGINLREIMEHPGSNTDLIMEDGDILRIPKQQQVVRIDGEVLYPSAVVYSDGKSFNDYVSNAGGFSPTALRKSAFIIYPNGTVKGTRKFLFFNVRPKVKPGSEIVVPTAPPPNPVNPAEVVGITSGLAALGAIIITIINSTK
jgi:protein involved in polysaccharide export with SLBB domain